MSVSSTIAFPSSMALLPLPLGYHALLCECDPEKKMRKKKRRARICVLLRSIPLSVLYIDGDSDVIHMPPRQADVLAAATGRQRVNETTDQVRAPFRSGPRRTPDKGEVVTPDSRAGYYYYYYLLADLCAWKPWTILPCRVWPTSRPVIMPG
jgi:hypothetical protein